MEKITLEPDLHLRLAADFSVVEVDGDVDDPSSFALTLMTALRAAEQGGGPLNLGKVKLLRGRDESRGFQLILDDSGKNLKRFPGVTRWADLEATAPRNRPGYPVLPAASDVPAWLDQLPGLRWRGLRNQAEDAWSHTFRDSSLDQEAVPDFGTSMLQLDLLLRSLDLPRREIQVGFEAALLRIAINADQDFLLALTQPKLSADEQYTLNRCLDYFVWPC